MIRALSSLVLILFFGGAGIAQTYNLVWSDEFDTNGAVNSSKWFHQTQLPIPGGWYNGEQQHYTDELANSSVNNGILKIDAIKESYTDQGVTKQYTSARLNSKFAFQYGKVEVRAKLPTGVGTWPAIWMLGKNIDENGAYWDNQGFGTTAWPACGEIDIMEHWGNNQNYVQSAMHTPSSFGGTINKGGQVISTASSAFHDYVLEWTADEMIFSVDGVVHYTYNPPVKDANTWPFDAEQYLILNVAIEAAVDPAFTSSAMEIDYVRVYQQDPPAVTFRVDVSDLTLAPSDVVYWNSNQNGWCGNCAPMTDLGNGIWEIVVDEGYLPGDWEYKFTINAWSIQENLDPVEDGNCTVTNSGFTNRIITVGNVDLNAGTFCWESCNSNCSSTPNNNVPMVAAPIPTEAPANVISMFSDSYSDVPVDTWLTVWSDGALTDTAITANATKRYENLNFVGVETVANQLDVSGMTTFHFDAWTPNLTELRVKLVDFGPNGSYDGPGAGDDTEHELTFANPTQGEWIEFDIPLADFTNLSNKSNIAQLIFAGQLAGAGTVYIDNIYFSNEPTVDANSPLVAAPNPITPATDVISLFSEVYSNVPVDTWQTPWSSAMLTDTLIDSNPTKRYDALNFVGVETVSNQINAAAMDTFHFDAWTPNMSELRVKLVDFGADAAFGGGDDTEHEITFANPALNSWVQFDIPLSDFTNLVNREHIAQLIFAAQPAGTGRLFVDNIYFSQAGNGSSSAPMLPAPIPTHSASSVISLYSNSYTNVPVDTWLTPWSSGNTSDTSLMGNATKKYFDLNFVGVETVNNQIDISGMETFHFDVWSPNLTQLRVKLVDFGANGAYDGPGAGDDTEHELVFENPSLNEWIEFDLALSDFTGLTNRNNIAQLIFSGQPAGSGVIYLDNIYFGAPETPSVAMRVFLQGPFDANTQLMNDDLRALGQLPSAEPYTALGFSYSGNGWSDVFDAALLNATGANAIVDWVVVDMFPDATEVGNTATHYSRPALLQRNGTVVNLDGTSPLMLEMPAGKYFAAIRHRNHLGAIEIESSDYGAQTPVVDFTDWFETLCAANAMHGDSLVDASRLLWSADVNFDGQIKYTGASNDRDQILVAVGGSVPTNTATGYLRTDVNMDGVVKYTGAANDRDIILQNIGGSVPTNSRIQLGF